MADGSHHNKREMYILHLALKIEKFLYILNRLMKFASNGVFLRPLVPLLALIDAVTHLGG